MRSKKPTKNNGQEKLNIFLVSKRGSCVRFVTKGKAFCIYLKAKYVPIIVAITNAKGAPEIFHPNRRNPKNKINPQKKLDARSVKK